MTNFNTASTWMSKRIRRSQTSLSKVYAETSMICSKITENMIIDNNNVQYIDFATLSYLSLHQKHLQNKDSYIQNYGYSLSVARTRVISELELQIEQRLNHLFSQYHPILFSSTHMTMLGILPLIASGDFPDMKLQTKYVFIFDKMLHQSSKILKNLLESMCEVVYSDCATLSVIESDILHYVKMDCTPIIVTDSLGSMGTEYPVKNLVDLVEKYQCYIVFDDAQSCSIHGDKGCGFVLKNLGYKKHKRVLFSTSFHKGFGGCGAVFLTPTLEQKAFIKCYATSYTFSGPIPISDLSRISDILTIHESGEIDSYQDKLWSNISLFDHHIDKRAPLKINDFVV